MIPVIGVVEKSMYQKTLSFYNIIFFNFNRIIPQATLDNRLKNTSLADAAVGPGSLGLINLS